MFKKASSLFKKQLQQAGIAEQVEATQVLSFTEEVLKSLFGIGTLLHAKPQSLHARTLTIAIAHPAVAEQIRQKEEHIIHEVNKRVGRPEVIRLQFTSLQEER